MLIKTLDGKKIKASPQRTTPIGYHVLGLLSEGEIKIENPLICTDTLATLNAVRAFGVKNDWNFVESSGEVKLAKISAFE
ncbi:hypothetical protein [Pyrococcus sp. ST04]|uniref:hypothetical protein n=1 Tax=Pyrococcus sp. ST04 TaxID=1183377 RepID=UPI00064E9119|nr:hypothetical protein [Pyrococcus sp. ST04]